MKKKPSFAGVYKSGAIILLMWENVKLVNRRNGLLMKQPLISKA
jgi:hypothetical protein